MVHAGLYYQPGSLKAKVATAGNASMVAFAREHGVDVDVCGKLVVATEQAELPRLGVLAERARANGVPARADLGGQAREYEPQVRCVAALRVRVTAIIDFPAVCAALVRLLERRRRAVAAGHAGARHPGGRGPGWRWRRRTRC